jgi:thiosulfate/3-mercaptopyruvate sulfurtransferase
MSTAPLGPLVSAEWLHDHLGEPDLRVIDFRWYLSGRKGVDEYLEGHIPGAVFVELDAVTGEGYGRHPLPSLAEFEEAMRSAGVGEATRVVVYDDTGGSVAARLWFLLRWFGHGAQAVLDGGLPAWAGPLEKQAVTIRRGDFVAHEPDRSRILDFDAVQRLTGVPLLDSRAGERYRGETEPIDPKAGHIPGARSAPFAGNLREDGRFKPKEVLRERFRALGVQGGDEVVVYCGSGVNACQNLLALELAGITDARLYAGSWSDWSNRDAPVATGSEA